MFLEQGNDLFGEHGPQFARRPGQHDQPAWRSTPAKRIGFHRDRQSRRGAVLVRQHDGAFRHQRLHFGAGRHRAFAFREKLLDLRQDARILDQFPVKQLRNEVAGEIIGSRTEAAGRNHEIGARQCFTHRLLNGSTVIGNGHLPVDAVAEVAELATEPLLVGIEHESQH